MALTKIDDRGLKTPIDLLDNEKIRFGTGNDLEIYHDGTNSFIENNTGQLRIKADSLSLRGDTSGESYLVATYDGAVELYYNNVKKFETTSNGITLADDLTIDNSTPRILMKVTDDAQNIKYEHYNTADSIVSRIIAETDGEISLKTGTNGTESAVVAKPNAEVQLFYNGSKKAYTQTTGMVFTNNNAPNSALDSSPVKLVLDNTSDHDWDHDEHCGAIIFKKDGNIVSGITGTHTRTGSGHSNEDGGIQIWTSPSANPTVPEMRWEFDGAGNFLGKDNRRIRLGDQDDLELWHDGTDSYIDSGTGDLRIDADSLKVRSKTNNEVFITATLNGAVELYHNNFKSFETMSSGIKVIGPEGTNGNIQLLADDGDDNADKWMLQSMSTGGFNLANATSGNWESSLKAYGDGAVELYYNNNKKFETASNGINIPLTAAQDGIRLTASGAHYAALYADINRTGADENILNVRADWDGTAVAQILFKTGADTTNKDDGSLQFRTSSGGGLVTRLTVQSGGGISFHGDTASANALNDYEEGTWTATYGGSTSNPTCTYDNQSGVYVKVGKLVTVHCRIRTDSVSGGSGHLRIKGFPFATAAAPAGQFGGYITFTGNWTGNNAPDMINMGSSATHGTLYNREDSNEDPTSMSVNDLNTTGDDNDIRFTAVYRTLA